MNNLQNQLAKKLSSLLFAGICIFGTGSVFGEYNSFKLGEAAGGYVFAVGLFEYLNDSECAYALNKPYSIDETIRSISPYFNSSDRKRLYALSNSQKFRNDITEMVNGMKSAAQSGGLDIQTTCGMMISTFSMLYQTAFGKWSNAKENYARKPKK